MDNIENLLRRHCSGEITHEEQLELERLTHREQVLAAAARRAKVLCMRRRVGVVAVSLLLVGGVSAFLPHLAGQGSEAPMVAVVTVPECEGADVIPADVSPLVGFKGMGMAETVTDDAGRSTTAAMGVPAVSVQPKKPSVATGCAEKVRPAEDRVASQPSVAATVVACNTSCSPDSVINDIWRFLRT